MKIKDQRLTRNVLKCLTCGTVIESKHRHDFVSCDCPIDSLTRVSVDGGLAYAKRSAGYDADWEDLSTYEECWREPYPWERDLIENGADIDHE